MSYKLYKLSTHTDSSLSEKHLLRSTITLEKGKNESKSTNERKNLASLDNSRGMKNTLVPSHASSEKSPQSLKLLREKEKTTREDIDCRPKSNDNLNMGHH